ncbi:MAG: hypothetical protein WC472_04185 [Candidatus Paceibacterota bacterium]
MNNNLSDNILDVIEIILEEKELVEDNDLLTISRDRFSISRDLLSKILGKLQKDGILELPDMAKRLLNESAKNPDIDFDLNYRNYVTDFVLIKPDYKKVIGYKQSILKTSKKEGSINRIPKIDDLKWDEITIKFIDGHNVKIKVRGNLYNKDYKDMGFDDSKNKKPDKQWALLKILSENRGSIAWGDSDATKKIKKTKQLLSDGLKNYFEKSDDPFRKYKKGSGFGYEIKIELLSNSEGLLGKTPKKNNNQDDRDDLGIEEYLNDVAPSVYE